MENPWTKVVEHEELMSQYDEGKAEKEADYGIKKDQTHLLHQLSTHNEWSKLSEVDGFLYVFDHLPDRMRLVVDFKITGLEDAEIAKIMKISEKTVKNVLTNAKKRFMRAIL